MSLNYFKKLLCFWLLAAGLASCGGSGSEEVEYMPVQFTEDGAWCFINAQGERVGTQEWEFEPSLTIGNIFVARTDSGLTVYRWKGDVASPVDSLQNLVSVGVYNEGLLPVTPPMQRIRIVDGDGNIVFVLDPIAGKEVSSCHVQFSEGLLVVSTTEGKCGVIDRKGNVVLEPMFDEMSDFSEGYSLAANYDWNDYEDGPKYFIVDREGKVTPVKGKFGYDEGDCTFLPEFAGGCVYVSGPQDTATFESPVLRINTLGQVTQERDRIYIETLDNGDIISDKYSDESSFTWKKSDGTEIMKGNGSLSAYGKYAVKYLPDSMIVYNENAQVIYSKAGSGSMTWPGGKFGPVITDYSDGYSNFKYILLDAQGQVLNTPNIFGYGTQKYLSLDPDQEMSCVDYVTSAYVDVTAAASKLVSMATGSLNGKKYYYLGQSVKDVLEGENASWYSNSTREFGLPTDSTGRLASGEGFWINGRAEADRPVTTATYKTYFEVHHYDYWGRPWGYNRTKQTGVQFNPQAKVDKFDIQLHTNHNSGGRLREAISRRMKKEGFTQTNTTPNYDEYTNGGVNVIVYGNDESHGVGAVVSRDYYMSDGTKAGLAATLY